MIELRGYIDENGNKRFAQWLDGLDAAAAAKVTIALARLEQGNFSKVKGVGSGVLEYKIDFGPGYRIYFGKDGDRLVILIGGGTKKRQQQAIAAARNAGPRTNDGRNRSFNNAPNPRLQGNHPSAGATRPRFPSRAFARGHRVRDQRRPGDRQGRPARLRQRDSRISEPRKAYADTRQEPDA